MGLTSSLFFSLQSLHANWKNFPPPPPLLFLLLLRFPGKHAARHTRGLITARASSFPPARSLYVLLLHFCAINRSLVYRDRSNYATISLAHKGRKCAFFATPHFQTDNERPINLPPFFDFVVDAFSASLCYWSGSDGQATKFRLAII